MFRERDRAAPDVIVVIAVIAVIVATVHMARLMDDSKIG
jgi:hypothetical protein